jgi:hypothetical protein
MFKMDQLMRALFLLALLLYLVPIAFRLGETRRWFERGAVLTLGVAIAIAVMASVMWIIRWRPPMLARFCSLLRARAYCGPQLALLWMPVVARWSVALFVPKGVRANARYLGILGILAALLAIRVLAIVLIYLPPPQR